MEWRKYDDKQILWVTLDVLEPPQALTILDTLRFGKAEAIKRLGERSALLLPQNPVKSGTSVISCTRIKRRRAEREVSVTFNERPKLWPQIEPLLQQCRK
ncbi:hypothetical protein C1J03_09545 [Sulfitobacter sp. SK012]|nr:hypothetical protein C1J03_09545 [Sulfitobacter sp. SK012]